MALAGQTVVMALLDPDEGLSNDAWVLGKLKSIEVKDRHSSGGCGSSALAAAPGLRFTWKSTEGHRGSNSTPTRAIGLCSVRTMAGKIKAAAAAANKAAAATASAGAAAKALKQAAKASAKEANAKANANAKADGAGGRNQNQKAQAKRAKSR